LYALNFTSSEVVDEAGTSPVQKLLMKLELVHQDAYG
jgi:hypothetical protein